MKVKIGALALADIDAIWVYSNEDWSEEQTIIYYNLIMDEFDHLAKYPNSGRSVESLGENYHFSLVKSHIVFFRIDHKRDLIEIIRVLHKSMNSTHWLQE